ncbi:hypothetical protein TSOC_003157 [Tetrabaena socialis]|uniref:Uncharacterized protein n=1 Tax=Tetrabaena socialis TaxID=47790 RepID=A0A2J8ACB3_9CHLO|nr:hypothetical protein TSOC_003157 [Tetrabaena socialis]|eukprot:PNH10133.1 hypothetical protein TSOC_003157 [Tetrabaena socialis]
MRGWRARRGVPGPAFLALTLALLAGANALACKRHSECTNKRFCNSVPFSRVDGVCEPCWKCCLFPERFNFPALTNLNNDVVYGGCTQSCSCNLRKLCASNKDCAPGLFCGKPGPVSPTICMRCTDCDLDPRAVNGACSSACPAGAILPLAGPSASVLTKDALVYMSFALEPWREPGSNRSLVKPSELAALLRNETSLKKVINATFSYNDTYVREAVASVNRGSGVPLASAVPLTGPPFLHLHHADRTGP